MADPAQPFGSGSTQGSSSITDLVTALQGVIRQIQAGNTQLAAIVAGLLGKNVGVFTVATLPASPSIGTMASVSDGGAALAWGAVVVGGGTAKYLCWFNGANWTVVGK